MVVYCNNATTIYTSTIQCYVNMFHLSNITISNVSRYQQTED